MIADILTRILETIFVHTPYRARVRTLYLISVVNGLPVCGILFRFGRKNEIRKEYLGSGF